MDIKRPLTYKDQVQRLIEHNMVISDKENAARILSEVNYYRFSGYALEFRDKDHPDDYIKGTTFEDVWHRYQFDSKLRSVLKPYLDTLEVYARSQIAYGFAMSKCQDPPYDQHYDPNNFFLKESHADIIVSSLGREKENSKNELFVIHHTDKYEGKMPLWVIVELLSFTNLSKFYSAMYQSEQDIIAQIFFTSGQTLRNHLHCLANLRNKVAHAGRLYNMTFNPPIKLGNSYLQKNPDIKPNTLFAYLIALIRRLHKRIDRLALITAIVDVTALYSDSIQLSLLGIPANYVKILCNEIH